MEIVHLHDQVTVGEGAKQATFWKFGDAIDFSTDLVIGFSPTNYHVFFICKNIEFHPQFAWNRARIIRRCKETIRAGALILIKGLGDKKIDKFHDYLHSQINRRFASCHLGVVQLINEMINPDVVLPFKFRYHPSVMVADLIYNEKSLVHIGQGSKFFLLKDESFDAFCAGIHYFESKFYYGYWASDVYLFFWNKVNGFKLRRPLMNVEN